VLRSHRRQDQLDDAVVLLLDDAADHPLAVEGQRHEEEQAGRVGHEDRGVARLLLRRKQGSGCQFGLGWEMATKRTDSRVRNRRRLCIDLRAEDEPVIGEEQQRVDLFVLERLPSGPRRGDHTKLHLRVVERLRRTLESRGKTGRHGRDHCHPVGRAGIDQAGEQHRAADQREDEERRGEKGLAAQPLANLAPGNEADRPWPAHRATSSRKSSASEGGP
jgi:hypothetical protein